MTDRHAQARLLSYPWPDPPAMGEACEIADGVLWFQLPLPMKLNHVNLYAFDEGDSWTLIDAGMAWAKADPILDQIMAGPLAGRPIGKVIVTHHHPDHVGYLGRLVAQGAEVWATRTAYLTARMLTLDAQDSYTPEAITFYRRAGMDADVLAKRQSERPFNFCDVVQPIPLGYRRIQQGDVMEFGRRSWDVHIGNGHAPEHATFWSRNDNLVLAGDQILPSISPNIGVYPTEPEADPVGEWLESCERFVQIAKDDHLVLGGHKLPFQGLPIRLKQLIDNHHGVLQRMLKDLETPRSAGETFAAIFMRSIGESEYGLALVEAFAHCQHLYHTGQVTRSVNENGAFVYRRN